MKHGAGEVIATIVLGVAGMTVLALPLFTQKDFDMNEKKMVLSFKRANPRFLDGVSQFTKGNLEKAEKKFIEALEIMPEHANAAYMLAKLQLKRKDFSNALATISSAEKNFVYIAKFLTLSQQQYINGLHQQRQDLNEQKNRLTEILANLPTGTSQAEKLSYESAIQSITLTIQNIDSQLRSPIPTTYEVPADYFFIHGNILYQMNALDDAATQYREAIRLDPRHGNACNNLALVSYSQGKYLEALNCLARAEGAGVKINPDFKRAIEAKIPPQ